MPSRLISPMVWKISLHEQRREAERRLVEQQQPRPRHERARDREHLLLAARERAGALLAALAQAREQLEHALAVRCDPGAVLAQVGAELEVLLDREVREDLRPSGDCEIAEAARSRAAAAA